MNPQTTWANPGPFKFDHLKSTELRNMRVRLHGKIVKLYSIGYLAVVSGKAKRTLRKYEQMRLLPRPIIRTPSSIRFYLAEEVYQYGTIIKGLAPSQGKRMDIDPTARLHLKEHLAQAKDRIRAKMNKDVGLIEAELKNEQGVADLSKICRANRKLRMLESEVSKGIKHSTHQNGPNKKHNNHG